VREQYNEEDVEKEGGGFHHRHRLERERERGKRYSRLQKILKKRVLLQSEKHIRARVSPRRVNITRTHSIYLLHYKPLQTYSSSDDFVLLRAMATFFNALINALFVVFETLFALRRKRDFTVESFAVRSNAVVNALIGFEAAD